MSDALLDAEEMEAIQAAIRESAPPRRGPGSIDHEPTRLALIADDRMADAARPVLIGLANRAVRFAQKALKNHLPGVWQLDVVGAEVVDGASAKDELRGGWIAGLRSGDAEMLVATHGAVIDVAAARRCGAPATMTSIQTARPPMSRSGCSSPRAAPSSMPGAPPGKRCSRPTWRRPRISGSSRG